MSRKFDPMLANGLVDVIREIVQEEESSRDSTILAEVVKLKGDNHVDVYIYPDVTNVVHNILNNSGYSLKVGDFVHLYKPKNQISQAFIISKLMPYAGQVNNVADVGSSNSSGTYRGWMAVTTQDSGLHWKLEINEQLKNIIAEKGYTSFRFGVIRYISSQTHQGRNIYPYRSYNKKGYTYTQYLGKTNTFHSYEVGGTISVPATYTSFDVTTWINNLILHDYNPAWVKKIDRARYKTFLKQGYWFRKYGFWIEVGGVKYSETNNCIEIRNHDNNPIDPATGSRSYENQGMIIKIYKN